MPNLSIKDVPEAWAQALRLRAARNHRSLQGELMVLIQSAVESESNPNGASYALGNAQETQPTDPQTESARFGTVVGFDRFGRPIVQRGWKTVEQVAAELKARYPNGPVLGQPLGVDIIREDRDSR